uniref:Amino acid transporter n=1 Tax=Schistosoma mansoni TaxID=6183 RepID=A0A3Q0KCR1_SCHMA
MDSNEEEYGTTFLQSDKNKPNDNTGYEMKTINQDNKKRETKRRNKLSKFKKWIFNLDNLFVTFTVLAVILGMTIGLLVKIYATPSPRTIYLLSFPGELLMNMLKMLIIPLIVSSLIAGLAGLDPKSSGKIGSYALIYYVVTTMLAVILGIGLVLCIHPGDTSIKDEIGEGTIEERRPETLDSLLDLLRNLFPENVVQACLQQQQSSYVTIVKRPKYVRLTDGTNGTLNMNNKTNLISYEAIKAKYVDSTNVLGLVSFSIIFGIILGQMGDRAVIMVQFFSVLNEVVMRMVQVIMLYSPFGIFFLILGKMLEIENLSDTAKALGLYMVTVISGLAIHLLGTLALLYYAVTRKNPFVFYKGLFQAWITALGTASSAATLPITFRCLEQNLGIDKRVTRFVLPIGATINMDGTALYEAVASIFIAQINGKYLTIIEVFIVSLTATLAAIGAASVPSAGLVTMMLVLTSVGLPTKDISLILAVDWLLDRIRTSINVMGDAVGAGIVNHLCSKELAQKDAEIDKEIDEVVEEYTRELSNTTSMIDREKRNSSSLNRHHKKRMSLAAAIRLQENTSPLGTVMPNQSTINDIDTSTS